MECLEAVKKFGRLDVAVNVAGLGSSGIPTHEDKTETWDKVVDIDLNGVWRSQRAEFEGYD